MRPALRLVFVLALAVLTVALLGTGTAPGRFIARRAALAFDQACARLWLAAGLGDNPRLQQDGWSVILPHGEAPWHDSFGRPSAPAGSWAERAAAVAAVAEDALGQLGAVSGVGDDGFLETLAGEALARAPRPRIVLYDSPSMLGPWARGSGAATGVYFAGVVGIEAGAATLVPATIGGQGRPAHLLKSTIVHELTHWALDRAAAGALPRWLSEGLALRAEERYAGASVPVELIRERARRTPTTIAGMTAALGRATRDVAAEAGAYLAARSLVAYLDDPASGGAVPGWEGRLAGELTRGRSFREAVADALGRDLRVLEEGWLEWLR